MPFKRPSFIPSPEHRAASKAERAARFEARLAAQKQGYEEHLARTERLVRLSSLTLRCRQDTWALITKVCGDPSTRPKDLGGGVIEVSLPGMYVMSLLARTRRKNGRAPFGQPELGRLNRLLTATVDQFDLDAPERPLPPVILHDPAGASAED